MSIDVEYAIKKDIRNNPVIRELDTRQKREFRRMVWLGVLFVWQKRIQRMLHLEPVSDPKEGAAPSASPRN